MLNEQLLFMTKAQKYSAEWSDFLLPECFSLLQKLNELLQNGLISFCQNIFLHGRRISAHQSDNFCSKTHCKMVECLYVQMVFLKKQKLHKFPQMVRYLSSEWCASKNALLNKIYGLVRAEAEAQSIYEKHYIWYSYTHNL